MQIRLRRVCYFTFQEISGVRGRTLPEAEEKAVGECIDADAKACPLAFNNCM
ncbi:hypothetical protein SMJ63A_70088 [Stenotrophomonas geniculata]